MRHRRKGRKLGRSPSHQRSLLRNLAINLFLTEREHDEALHGGKKPAMEGRIITTLAKAKEARPFVERCITIAKGALAARERADELSPGAERNTEAWRTWRASRDWHEWSSAVAPVVTARRRLLTLLGHNNKKSKSQFIKTGAREAVEVLLDKIAPRFADRPGGYTRVLRLAKPRLGDAGPRAILELVGKHDRKAAEAPAPAVEGAEGTDQPTGR
jgi:large subunit ribosomal protein L17